MVVGERLRRDSGFGGMRTVGNELRSFIFIEYRCRYGLILENVDVAGTGLLGES